MPSRNNTPQSVTIRMYQMGFGDCFLLTVHYPTRERHILIDFGCQRAPEQATGRKSWLVKVAKDIEERVTNADDEPELDVVVATHRHQDHISGFATDRHSNGPGAIIQNLNVRKVIQPWTEHPRADTDARFAPGDDRRGFRKQLASMHQLAEQIATRATRLRGATPEFRKRMGFLGQNNISNKSAVTNLMQLAENEYVREGSRLGLGPRFPGVKVHVLGPPTLQQSDAIRRQTRRHEEFWTFQSSLRNDVAQQPELFPTAKPSGRYPSHARWFVKQVQNLSNEGLFGIVRALDRTMNNTSLILLFEIGKKKFLFPGDAQIENWSHALSISKYQRMLKQVDVYKVGHHGSLNATPKQRLWNEFTKRGNSRKTNRLTTLLSTMPGVHGHGDSGTEVPRDTLLKQLGKKSRSVSTSTLDHDHLYIDVLVDV